MPRFVPLGDSMIEIIRAAKLVGLVADVQGLVGAVDAAVAGGSGRYADAAHKHPALIATGAGLAGFTGTAPGPLVVQKDGTLSRWAGLDLTSSAQGPQPIARIGMFYGGGGSLIAFGTSNSYGLGITNQAMTIDPSGKVGIGPTAPADFLHLQSSSPWIRSDDTSGSGKAWRIGSGLIALGDFGIYNQTDGLSVIDLTPTGDFHLVQPSAALRFQDASGTPNKYLRAAGGTFELFDSAFSALLWQVDNGGNVVIPQASATLQLSDASATPHKYLRAQSGALQVLNSAASQVLAAVDESGRLSLPQSAGAVAIGAAASGAGLQVGASGAVIPAIFVQAATPTEIDGALWFQG